MRALKPRAIRPSWVETLVSVRTGLPPLVVAVGVTAAYALYVVWRLRGTGGDPSFFVVAGPLAADPTSTPPNLHVFPPGTTYDGQFFYRLALEPWTNARTAYGITFDGPAYRQQRILYPLIAWVLSAAQWQLTPSALIVANLLAVGVLAYAAAAFAARLGRHVLTSVVVPAYPGYVVTISRDLAELTEAALLVLGLVLLERRRYWLGSAALTAGMLAKETLLVVPLAGVLLWALARRRPGLRARAIPVRVWVVPLVAYAAWSAIMALRWGATGVGQGYINFGVPLVALVEHLRAIGLGTAAWRANELEWFLLGLIGAAVAAVLATYGRRALTAGVLPLACVTYAGLALLYTTFIWRDDHSYLRALHELFLTAALALLAASTWAPRVLAPATILASVVFALQTGWAP